MAASAVMGFNADTGRYSVLVKNVNGGYAVREFEDEKDASRFCKEVNLERQPDFDKIEISDKSKKKGGLAKAGASLLITGLGQACDGRYGDGIKQLLAQVGLGVVGYLAVAGGLAAKSKNAGIALMGTAVAAGLGALAVKIHSVVDAYKS